MFVSSFRPGRRAAMRPLPCVFLVAAFVLVNLLSGPIGAVAQSADEPTVTEVSATATPTAIPPQAEEPATATPTAMPSPTVPADTPTPTASAPETTETVPTDTPEPTPTASTPPDEPLPAPSEPAPTTTSESTAVVRSDGIETATLHVRTIDHLGNLVPGATYWVTDEAGGAVGNGNGVFVDGNPGDGITTLTGLPTSPIVIRQTERPAGYLAAADPIHLTLTPGETTIDVTSPLGGRVVTHFQDENGDPSDWGCAGLFADEGGVRGALVRMRCGYQSSPRDTIVLDSLPAGSYVFGYGTWTPEYAGGPDVPLTIALGETVEKTLQLVPTGTLIIHKQTPDDQPLAGACFKVYRGTRPAPQNAGIRCEGDAETDGEGVATLHLAPGDHMLMETRAPFGYARADDVSVHIESRQTTEVTIVDPVASKLAITVTDRWDLPIWRACVTLLTSDASSSVFTGCVNRSSLVTFGPLQPGDYLLRLDSAKSGFGFEGLQPVHVGLSETTAFTFRLNGPPPDLSVRPMVQSLSQSSAVIYWETNRPTAGSLAYGRTDALELTPPPPDAEATVHRFTLSNLQPNRTYYFEAWGTNADGWVASGVYWFTTPPATATARLSITKTNSDGTVRLPGSCFELFTDAGGGRLGEFAWYGCDRFDAAPADGKLLSGYLLPELYVLVELHAPSGYTTAKPIRLELADGKIKRVTVKDTRGGAVLTVTTRAASGNLLPGACYAVYQDVNEQPGALVAFNCDDYDGLDGNTVVSGLRAGSYLVLLTETPAGYHFGIQEYFGVRIRNGQGKASLERVLQPLDAPSTAVIRSVDAEGRLLTGACYDLYINGTNLEDGYLGTHCDGSDGHVDGLVYLLGLAAQRYTFVQVFAPQGYQVGTKVSFTKQDGRPRTLTVTQTKGGVAVRVTTRTAGTGTVQPGACYVLIKPGAGYQEFVTGGCDNDGDGVVVLRGIPSGKYRLIQTLAPAGYRRASDRDVTVGSSNVSVRVDVARTR